MWRCLCNNFHFNSFKKENKESKTLSFFLLNFGLVIFAAQLLCLVQEAIFVFCLISFNSQRISVRLHVLSD